MSKTADELRARNREANEYARTFNKIALMHGHDLPMALLGELIALFDMALAPSVDKPTASAEVVSQPPQEEIVKEMWEAVNCRELGGYTAQHLRSRIRNWADRLTPASAEGSIPSPTKK